MGMRLKDAKKYVTPAPSAYEPEKTEKWLAEKAAPSMGIKPNEPKKIHNTCPICI